MKKFAAVVAVAVLFAFAAPVFAATNPFMDVPMGHWAYDAIGQLAAHGILSGYPDGTYKGKQPTTRYEMASALARALAVVDMTKASKQDVEMLKKLVLEFKDELDALGVKVDALDKRVAVLEDRLGGWKLSGQLRLDVENWDSDDPNAENEVRLTRARVIFDRWFGDEEKPMHFQAILRGDSGDGTQTNLQNWKQFFVEIPFFWDSMLTVGRFAWDMEDAYYITGDNLAGMENTGGLLGLDSYLTDRDLDALGWDKEFGLGRVSLYVAHDPNVRGINDGRDDPATGWMDESTDYENWEFMVKAQLQFNEQFGFDLGAQAFWGDNAEPAAPRAGDFSFDSLWTIFAGLRFNWNDSIAFKGIYYYQNLDVDVYNGAIWNNAFPTTDDPSAWKLIVDVSQEALKFTSLWLEYGQVDANFTSPTGIDDGSAVFVGDYGFGSIMPADVKYFRIAAGQKWNDKWATHLFYYGYDFDNWATTAGGAVVDTKLKEWGLGVQYTYNPNVKFGLNYVKLDWDNNAGRADNHLVRFRTQVSF